MSSEGTAYSPSSSPKTKDFAAMNRDNEGQYGSGPGLKDPNDPIQNSDQAFDRHMEKQRQTVGPGPSSGIRRPSHTARYEHFEHQEQARSPTHEVSKDVFDEFTDDQTPHTHFARRQSTKTEKELRHHNTLSSLRTKIGLAPEAPILDEHDVHESLRWSSIRTILREPFAEFFGVFIMILFGDGSVAQVLLSGGEKSAPGMNGFGNYQSISWGYAALLPISNSFSDIFTAGV